MDLPTNHHEPEFQRANRHFKWQSLLLLALGLLVTLLCVASVTHFNYFGLFGMGLGVVSQLGVAAMGLVGLIAALNREFDHAKRFLCCCATMGVLQVLIIVMLFVFKGLGIAEGTLCDEVVVEADPPPPTPPITPPPPPPTPRAVNLTNTTTPTHTPQMTPTIAEVSDGGDFVSFVPVNIPIRPLKLESSEEPERCEDLPYGRDDITLILIIVACLYLCCFILCIVGGCRYYRSFPEYQLHISFKTEKVRDLPPPGTFWNFHTGILRLPEPLRVV